MKKIIGNFLPKKIIDNYKIWQSSRSLNFVKTKPCNISNLRTLRNEELKNIFYSSDYSGDWDTVKRRLNEFNIPNMAGGINIGDQQAIYYLIREFMAKSVLEIGTHIGCSTAVIALAMSDADIKSPSLNTVDIIDVNKAEGPWRSEGCSHSPSEMIKSLGVHEHINFNQGNSMNFLENTIDRYDFIFLDGSHLSHECYIEISLALKVLNPKGLILLHDYFPDMKSLWPNSKNSIIPGPFLAVNRFQKENKNLGILPLGELPWKTKYNSNFTSLAFLTKKD